MLPGSLRACVERALAEDVRSGDITGRLTLDPNWEARAIIRTRQRGVFAGGEIIGATYDLLGEDRVQVDVLRTDGDSIRAHQVLAEVAGPARVVLAGERVLLNFLQRLCGIATMTAKFVAATKGTPARIVDTRKTTPGLRMLEKHAVRCGGGMNHRFGLDDCVMIKDNHVQIHALHTGLTRTEALVECVRRACAGTGHTVCVVAEADTPEEAYAACKAGADVVMLDNFPLADLRTCARKLRKLSSTVTIEASGGITLRTVRAVAQTGVDIISVGALTHSPPALDIGMDIL